jgi:DNA-binding beta-propeller fold protein YncE
MNAKFAGTFAFVLGLLALGACPAQAADAVPKFTVDTSWPKPLPNHWQIGPAERLFVDRHDLIWLANQSNKLDGYDLALENGKGKCCNMAPQIIAFDRAGNVVKSWRVSGPPEACKGFRCFDSVHEVYVDYKDNVWMAGHGEGDSQVLKFDYNGKFLLQIGGSQEKDCCGNQDTENVGGGTAIAVWPATNEVFVTDGYVNRRVIVFDADTGKFKRMWGAYGHQPPVSAPAMRLLPGEKTPRVVMASPDQVRTFEGEGPKEWSTVHAIAITPDGVVWIADRQGNRIQQFKIDGTFIREAYVNRENPSPAGTVYNFAFSPDGKYVYIPVGPDKQVAILERNSLKQVGSFGNCGGQLPGCFYHLHVADADSAGNVYTGEAASGHRIQKFKLVK